MVCTNCQSKDVIRVKDEYFCTNCGFTMPDPVIEAAQHVDQAGLPDGVKILNAPDNATQTAPVADITDAEVEATAKASGESSLKRLENYKSPDLEEPELNSGKPVVISTDAAGAQGAISSDVTDVKSPDSQPTAEAVSASKSLSPETENLPVAPANDIADEPAAKITHTISDKATAKPKKRRVGRPKADRLDLPVTATAGVVAATVVNSSEATAPIKVSNKMPVPALAKIADNPSAKPDTPVITQPKPKHSKPRSGSMSDIRPVKTPAAAKPESDAPTVVSNDEVLLAAVHHPQTKAQSIRTGDILAESWQGRFMPRHALFALVPAVILALLAAGIAAAVVGPKSGQIISITRAAAIPVIGDLLLILALYYVCRSLATAAITFAAARAADHRKVPVDRWLGVAVNSFGGKLRFDLFMLIGELALGALIVALIIIGGVAWPIPDYLQIGIIFSGLIILLYALSGLLLTQGFGRVGVVLGVLSARRAFVVGWGFFRRHFELVGAKLLSLIAELIIVVPLVAAVIAVGWSVGETGDWWFLLALALAVAVGGVLIGAGTAIWWEAAYRQLVRTERISEAVSLLTGRMADRAHRWPLIFVSMIIFGLVIAITIWPWLPWPSLG